MRIRCLSLLLLLCAYRATLHNAAAPAAGASTPPVMTRYYGITDLGKIDECSNACGINAQGLAIGFARNAAAFDRPEAFVWKSGIRRPVARGQHEPSYAFAVNVGGDIVGYCSGKQSDRACLWRNGKQIPLLPDKGAFSQAFAINNRGWAAGVADIDGRYGHACVWRDGKRIDAGTLGTGRSCLYGLNDKGQAVGYYLEPFLGSDNYCAPFVWQDGKATALSYSGVAYGINNSGQIVGFIHADDSHEHACLWQNGKATLLDTRIRLDSYAYAINDQGQAVGVFETENGRVAHAALWRQGKLIDLNHLTFDKRWKLGEARAINDQGLIVGAGRYLGALHAFLLTPSADASDADPSVPQPSGDSPRANLPPASWSASSPEAEVWEKTVFLPADKSIEAVISSPQLHRHEVETQAIIQPVWPLPAKEREGDLRYQRSDYQPEYLPHDGQTPVFFALRLTNRSPNTVRLHLFDSLMPAMRSQSSQMQIGYSVPPNIRTVLFETPPIAPGQSFTVCRPARLAWERDHLTLQFWTGSGLSQVFGLQPGQYSVRLSCDNDEDEEGILDRRLYTWWVGDMSAQQVSIVIR